jgi:hypothetical protein
MFVTLIVQVLLDIREVNSIHKTYSYEILQNAKLNKHKLLWYLREQLFPDKILLEIVTRNNV